MRRLVAVLALSLASVACGGSSPPAASAPAKAPAASATEPDPAAPTPAPAALTRAQVRDAIKRGVGAFLNASQLTFDDWPVMQAGKFHGFRLRSIRSDLGLDLKPGDVLLSVNGMPIERPEQADAAMRSLEKATALRVDYERDGAPRVIEIPIVD